MRLLHIVPDDKFIDDAIELYDSIENVVSRYVCIVDDPKAANYKFEYIKRIDKVDVIAASDTGHLWQDDSIDMYVFHSLPEYMYKYVLAIPKEKKVFWSSWGIDIYTASWGMNPIINLDLYKPITKKCLDTLYQPKLSIISAIKRRLKYIINYRGFRDDENRRKENYIKWLSFRQRVIERIDYISTVLPIEYDMLSKIDGFRAKYVPFQYTAKSIDNLGIQKSQKGSYLMLGNSADFSNNHLDVLNILRERAIKNMVYIPLAYGDNDCKQCVTNNIHSNDNVLLQDNFIPMQAYMDIVGKCKVAIFGHIRQQALGNIRMAMLNGMKIFFYKDSVCYKYFKANEYTVYSIEDDLTQTSIDQTMENEYIVANAEKLNHLFLYNNVLQRMQNFFDTLINDRMYMDEK